MAAVLLSNNDAVCFAKGRARQRRPALPAAFGKMRFRRRLRCHPQPVIHFLADLIFGIPVAILDLAFQLIAASIHDRQVVVREFSPFLLDSALELFPATFDAIPIHHSTSGFFGIERVTPTPRVGSGAVPYST